MRIVEFTDGKKQYANIYLSKSEGQEQYQKDIDVLLKTHFVSVIVDGDKEIKPSLKQALTN